MSYSDDEQVEALRSWWRENGRSVIAGVVIAVVALIGWQQWNAYQQRQAEAAAAEYAALLEQIQAAESATSVTARGATILEQYGRTAYAPLAAFMLAQYHVDRGELDQAAERLRWAVEKSGNDALVGIARLRLARVLGAQQRYDDALAQLDPAPAGLLADYQEVRGDLLAESGQTDDAIGAYRAALADDQLMPQRRTLIQLKLNDLGAGEEPAA